jgi:hypothetical protein
MLTRIFSRFYKKKNDDLKNDDLKNDDFDEKFLQFDTCIFLGTITEESMSFISRLMVWCTYSTFQSPWSDWFLDDLLCIHASSAHELSKWPCVIRTCYRDCLPQRGSLKEFDALHKRLERNARSLILVLIQKGTWEYNRVNLTAVCIAVAEVTEEISFIFNQKESIGVSVLLKAASFAFNDDGILYKLAVYGSGPEIGAYGPKNKRPKT